MTKKRSTPWGWIIAALSVFFVIGLLGLVFIVAVVGGGALGNVGVINYYGPIADTEGGRLFSARGPRDFISDLDTARRDRSLKAVVVRINSPGGSAAASQEMYQAIRRLRETKPVVCSMGDVAASGGYYMAAACDKIYANPATVTGSIGVISQFINIEEALQKLGISDSTFTSGRFKDSGSPFRELRPEERELFQALIRDIYNQFLDDVVAGRKSATNGKLTRAELMKVADGRVLTGRQAKQSLLVDELGGLREAIEAAGKLGGVEGTPSARQISRGGSIGALLGGDASTPAGSIGDLARSAGAAFAQGFAQTFAQQLRENAASQSTPQTR